MNSYRLLGLVLVLVPVALANPWAGGCVQLYHRKTGDFLVTSLFTHDKDRRHLGLAGAADLWLISDDPDHKGYYRIKDKQRGEELFESVQNYKGHYVFVWIPKTVINDGGASWAITGAGDGYYIFKNKKFNHCLWSKGKGDWVGAYEGCDHSEYQWKITRIAC